MMMKLGILGYSVLSFVFVLLLISISYGVDQVHTAVSIDNSPSWFTVVGSITNGSTLSVNSALYNNYSVSLSPSWNHNFATYVYGGSISQFLNNSNIYNQASLSSLSLNNDLFFMNVLNWSGYNWNNFSNDSYVTNNGIVSNMININNVIVNNPNLFRIYNYSFYPVEVVNAYIVNNGYVRNSVNVSNSNISDIFNFSISSYDVGGLNSYTNNGIVENVVNLSNTLVSNGVYNYSLNSYVFSNPINCNMINTGSIINVVNSISSSSNELRNQAMISFNQSFLDHQVSISNTGSVLSVMNLSNSNHGSISNDGIAVYNSNRALISNTGSIRVRSYWDSSFNGNISSISGILLSGVREGRIDNQGIISVRGNNPNASSWAGIYLFSSGTANNPILISTPVLMDLDSNTRSIIVNASHGRLERFSFYINGDPSSASYIRPILINSNSTLDVTNAMLYLFASNNLHLNKPYYIIENVSGNVIGEFNNSMIVNFSLPSYINLNWYSNQGQNSSVIFTVNTQILSEVSHVPKITRGLVMLTSNLNDLLRNNIVLEEINRELNQKDMSSLNRDVNFRGLSFYQRIDSANFNFNGSFWGRGIIFDKMINRSTQGGLVLLAGKANLNSDEIYFEDKSGVIGYGLYLNYKAPTNYLLALFNNYNFSHTYKSSTGVDFSLPESSKYNTRFYAAKIEYGSGTKNRFYMGFEMFGRSSKNYHILTPEPLWNRHIRSDSISIVYAYVGIDNFNINQNQLVFYTVKLSFPISNKRMQVIETIQGNDYIYSSKLSSFYGQFALFYKPLNLSSFSVALQGDISSDYVKYMLKIQTRF
ncbi:MAG: hypothetical protein ABDH21_00575 [bacterium]